MRRVSDERGAVAVTIALLLVALLGIGAFVIDVGAMYQERRELQNGADAAALAIAENCARGLATCATSYLNGTSATYLNGNALDGTSTLDSASLDLSARTINIQASTRTSAGTSVIPFSLAQVLGFSGKHVTAKATATWGYPGSLTALPLTIEACEFYKATAGAVFGTTVILQFHKTGNGSASATTCSGSPSGQDFPGGFGWLDTGAANGGNGTCSFTSTSGSSPSADTGNDVPTVCRGDDASGTNAPSKSFTYLQSFLGKDIALPVYDSYTASGNNGTYHIAGYGAFHLLGFKFNGGIAYGDTAGCSGVCLKGYFTQQVLSSSTGGTVNFGVFSISLTN